MQAEAGFEKTQDCKVNIDIKDSGGIVVKVESNLENMFGRHIKESAIDELKKMGIENAEINIKDFSSLDFVIRARIKTAVERARGIQNG